MMDTVKQLTKCQVLASRQSQLLHPQLTVHSKKQRHQACMQTFRTQTLVCSATQSSGLTSSVSLGPSLDEPGSSTQNGASAPLSVDQVELQSEADEDYTVLRDHLAKEEFEEADDVTRATLIRLAGPDAEKRGWVYFTEVKFIPEADLRTIDSLWRASSNNKFGYSVQKDLFRQSRQRWDRFFQEINWVQGPNNMYRKWPKEFKYTKDAPKGHLPLTNALRGTQLFKAIMEHPAFDKPAGEDKPSWLS